MDIEFQRMKERLETIHLILDDMQVDLLDNYLPYFPCYEVNKKRKRAPLYA